MTRSRLGRWEVVIKTMMRTSVALGLATAALLSAAPAHAVSADAPNSPSLTDRGSADETLDMAADLALDTLVGKPNNDEDGLTGAVLPRKKDGLTLGGLGAK
ncbi:hypothetical protein ACIQM4_29885 [Streptomyces sp. NPDC091272]|uniref:hypothetical protein n=1 Tax=Streptomyces sp. NPDC091272 TaxID=3365981 RepID=UPI00380CFF9D